MVLLLLTAGMLSNEGLGTTFSKRYGALAVCKGLAGLRLLITDEVLLKGMF
jgi:hypothetical protein